MSENIKKWYKRTTMYADPQQCMAAMESEIADLHAALAQRAKPVTGSIDTNKFAYLLDNYDRACDVATGGEMSAAYKAIVEHVHAWQARAAIQQQAGVPDGAARELTDDDIDVIWRSMPGGPAGWIKSFGYQQFAREIEAAILDGVTISAAPTLGGAK